MIEPGPLIIMAAGKGSRMKAAANVSDRILKEAASRPKAMIRIGKDRKPLLQHIVEQAAAEGITEVCLVIGEGDRVTPAHFQKQPVPGVTLSTTVQSIPPGRDKPEGTAQAVQLALEQHPHWKGKSVVVANGDNLPPKGMFAALLLSPCALPAFDREHLGLPIERVEAFAVIRRGGQGELLDIQEKPEASAIEASRWSDGTVRVSMNYFRMPWADLLSAVRQVPEHPVRKERELPVAISLWNAQHPGHIAVLPMSGAFLDLTHPQDIEQAGKRIDGGGATLID